MQRGNRSTKMTVYSSGYSMKACEQLYQRNNVISRLGSASIGNTFKPKSTTNDNVNVNCHMSTSGYLNRSNCSVEMSHLWECGQWTSANEFLFVKNAKMIDIRNYGNFLLNKHKPKLSVISPNSIESTLLLSKLHVTRYFVCLC